ncbi:MAG TPA: hypothetical protein VFU27_09805 [Terriglobales bacterium]|nr:hypothetical protein [Terriglobales bacterium]
MQNALTVGFQTVGNATLIAYDGEPVLATDPWIKGEPYFGSWTWPYQIPREQTEQIRRCRYIWFSHGHPDHLNASSLDELSDKQILLADHVGKRLYEDLKRLGFNVRILPERRWVRLSKNIRIMTLSDYFQDSILLVDLNGRLVMDLNDAVDRGWGRFVRGISREYKNSYLLKLSGYGDADMINLFTENGLRIMPYASQKNPVGRILQGAAKYYRARYVVPFSSFHLKQREDSAWANQYNTPLAAYREGFESSQAELLPAFISVDCANGAATPLHPQRTELVIKPAASFGDNWAEPLEARDRFQLKQYILAKQKLKKYFGFITFRVGGQDTTIDVNKSLPHTGICFEAPRQSLMTAVEYQVFDDLLIGNFMKTTLIGCESLYPHFTPIVAKYADNGRAQSSAELRRYFWEYFKRAPLELLSHILEEQSVNMFRAYLPPESLAFRSAKRVYSFTKGNSLEN